MKIFLIVVLAILVLFLVVFGVYLTLGYLSYHFAMARNSRFKKKIEERSKKSYKENEELNKYFNKEDFEEIEIFSNDDLKLKAMYKNKQCQKLAILVHGYGGTYKDMYNYAKIYEERGYDILAIDMRAHGKSEGDFLSFGLYEHYDLLRWIDKMLEYNKNYKIVLHGVSMGASTVCMCVGEKLPNNVICAIEDCGYDNAYNQTYYVFSKMKLKLSFVYKIFYNYLKKTKNLDLKQIDMCSKLKKSSIPIFFIHGDSDNFVPTEMVYKLYECLPDTRRALYISKDTTHAVSIENDFKEYKSHVNKFLDKYCM